MANFRKLDAAAVLRTPQQARQWQRQHQLDRIWVRLHGFPDAVGTIEGWSGEHIKSTNYRYKLAYVRWTHSDLHHLGGQTHHYVLDSLVLMTPDEVEEFRADQAVAFLAGLT